MIQYIKNLFKKFKELTVGKKILTYFLIALYVGIILICTISSKYNYTSPGTLNRINQVITIDDKEVTNNFYTVSVFTETKSCSILEHLFRKWDRKQEIMTEEEYGSVYTTKEEQKIGEAQKNQSIQDSIICAYEMAKEDGYDVNLIKTFKGVCVCYMPSNYFGTGPESLQIKDVITKIGDETINGFEDLEKISVEFLDKYQEDRTIKTPVIEIIRSGEPLTLDNCSARCLAQIGLYYKSSRDYATKYNLTNYYCYLTNFVYDYYDLDTANSKPAFHITQASSIGPSGGLCQTLYVYNALTDNSLTIDNEILTATGTIIADGTVGVIGSVDKKVYTIDIYMSKYFFVPKNDYDDAMEAYKTLKKPQFEIVSVENARDAIKFLKAGSGE